MKTSHDPRHLHRIQVMQELFSYDFSDTNPIQDRITKDIIKNKEKIDEFIQQSAPAWPLEKINKIDLSILRIAVYELIVDPTAPPKVVVDEAIEIAKEFGAQSSPSFVNGALGKLIADNNIQT